MYLVAGGGLGQTPSVPTNCSAVSVHRFDKQPPELQRVISQSFRDPADWFERLDRDSRFALTSIFNRMCSYGVWHYVRRILKIAPAEAPVIISDQVLRVPGRTPSVYFVGPGTKPLSAALIATRRFCRAYGTGASQHKGQVTLREISVTDSLHISLGPGERFDAHIDKYSPVPEHPGSELCSNVPTPAAVTYVVRELFPETIREKIRVPGVQVMPEVPPPPAGTTLPQGAVSPSIIAITAHPGVRPKPRAPRVASPLLSVDVVTRIDHAVKEQVAPDALLPSHVRVRRARTRQAAEKAGPNEAAAARYAREVAEQEAQSYPDAQEFALKLAELMEQARRTNVNWVKVVLPQYGSGDFGSRRAIAGQIRRIALILRNYLPDRAKDVRSIVITFGTGNVATREEAKLPSQIMVGQPTDSR